MLSISARSSKMAEERTPREHLTGGSRKLVWDAHINVFRTVSTTIFSIEDLHSVDSDCSAVVNGKPGWAFFLCVTHVLISHRLSLYVSVNALGCWEHCLMNDTSYLMVTIFSTNPIIIVILIGWWLDGCNRMKQLNSTCKGTCQKLLRGFCPLMR